MKNIETILNWLETAKGSHDETTEQELNLCLNINLEELSELSESMGKKQMLYFVDLLEKKAKEIISKIDKNEELKEGREHVIDALVDMEWVKTNVLYFNNITAQEYQEHFDKVTESNYSKFCKTIEEAEQSVEMYKQKGIETIYVETFNSEYPYVILRKSDMKILKSINFKEPK
jgi:DNA-directed RNA polymerase specialized sigma subunit